MTVLACNEVLLVILSPCLGCRMPRSSGQHAPGGVYVATYGDISWGLWPNEWFTPLKGSKLKQIGN